MLWDIEHAAHGYWEQLVTGDGVEINHAMIELRDLSGKTLRDAVLRSDDEG